MAQTSLDVIGRVGSRKVDLFSAIQRKTVVQSESSMCSQNDLMIIGKAISALVHRKRSLTMRAVLNRYMDTFFCATHSTFSSTANNRRMWFSVVWCIGRDLSSRRSVLLPA